MRDIPLIETARLVLRGHTRADFEPMAAMWAEESVTRFIGGTPSSREESWSRFLKMAGHWQFMSYGYWAIEEKQTGRYAGALGFSDFKREMDAPVQGMPEHGWALAPWAHGKGYATEAVNASLHWAKRRFEGATLWCMIDAENAASIRVAEKVGYARGLDAAYLGFPRLTFSRNA